MATESGGNGFGGGDSPPPFDGDIASYKEWRRRAELWVFATRTDTERRGPRLLQSLRGAAWEACQDIKLENLSKDKGWNDIFDILDALFGQSKDVLQVESLDEALYATTRKANEDFVSFCTRLEHKFRKLDENCSVKLPSVARGYVLARQWGLTAQEMREVLVLSGGKLEIEAIKPALRRLLYDFKPKAPPKVKGAYVVNTDENDSDAELDAALQAIGETDWTGELPEELDEDEAEAVLLSYKEARDRVKDKKLGCGFKITTTSPSTATFTRGRGFRLTGKLNLQELIGTDFPQRVYDYYFYV